MAVSHNSKDISPLHDIRDCRGARGGMTSAVDSKATTGKKSKYQAKSNGERCK